MIFCACRRRSRDGDGAFLNKARGRCEYLISFDDAGSDLQIFGFLVLVSGMLPEKRRRKNE